jgi:hypothetical protein
MRPFTFAIPSALLVFAMCLPSSGGPPVFTFSMGIQGGQDIVCFYCPDGTYQCPRPVAWMRVDASSNGTVIKQGNVPFDISISFSPNRVDWVLTPSTSDIVRGAGCADGCCSHGDMYGVSPPSVDCTAPIFPPFVPEWFEGCRPDWWSGIPNTSVIAEWLPNPHFCSGGVYASWLLGGCQSGTVRYTFCREDFDASGSIDGGDLGILLAVWGAGDETYPPIWMCARADLDDSGSIDGADLGILLAHWGDCAIPN